MNQVGEQGGFVLLARPADEGPDLPMTSKPRSAVLAAQCLILLAVAACSQEPVARSSSADGTRAPSDPPASPVEPSPVPEGPAPIVEGATAGTTSSGTDAAVFLTFGSYSSSVGIEVAGYVADRVEAGGTCELTLTHGRQVRSVSGPAVPDARTTVCTLTVPSEQLAEGTWEAVLSYRSQHAAGSSEPLPVEVP